MKPSDRQRRIVTLVDRAGEVSVDALVAAFDVSAETIRRDLAHLAGDGALIKAHGLARRPRRPEGSFDERMTEDAAAKAAIGEKIADHLAPGQTVLIDTGTTTLACAPQIARIPGLTVVTNSARMAQAVAQAPGGARVHLLGGRYVPGNAQTVGPETIDHVTRFHADVAILTVTGLDPVHGATDADFDEAQVARAMLANARKCIVLATVAKFGRTAAHRVCRLDQVDVVLCDGDPQDDTAIPADMAAACAAAGTVLA